MTDIKTKSENERTIAAFCAQFVPPLKYVRTEKVNMVPMPDAWTTSLWDDGAAIGITVIAYGGGIHAYLECAGKSEIAANAGRVFAKALGLFQGGDNGSS
jgi:hypothetical protein